MRTTINIDDKTCNELMQMTSTSSRAEAIRSALAEFIELKRKEQLIALRGKLDITDNWQELRTLDTEELPHG